MSRFVQMQLNWIEKRIYKYNRINVVCLYQLQKELQNKVQSNQADEQIRFGELRCINSNDNSSNFVQQQQFVLFKRQYLVHSVVLGGNCEFKR